MELKVAGIIPATFFKRDMNMDKKTLDVKFEDVKDRILAKLNKLGSKKLGLNEEVMLIDGIINQPLNPKVTGNVVVGGPVVPVITLVGKETGRLYFFALKVLLEENDNA